VLNQENYSGPSQPFLPTFAGEEQSHAGCCSDVRIGQGFYGPVGQFNGDQAITYLEDADDAPGLMGAMQ
jgi:hypothetical protein